MRYVRLFNTNHMVEFRGESFGTTAYTTIGDTEYSGDTVGHGLEGAALASLTYHLKRLFACEVEEVEESTMNYAQMVQYMKNHDYCYLSGKDATGNWYDHKCIWKDSNGLLVMAHPTDPKRAPIAPPTDGMYVAW